MIERRYCDFALSGKPDVILKWFADNGFRLDYEKSRWTSSARVRKVGNKTRTRVDVVVYVLCDGSWCAVCLENGEPMPGPTWAEGPTPALAVDRLCRKMNGEADNNNQQEASNERGQ